MLVLIILLATPLLALETEFIRLDEELDHYYKDLPGSRLYEISVFARHGEYFVAYLMTDDEFEEEWYDVRDERPPPDEYIVVNSTDNDVIFEHKSKGDSYLVFYRGGESLNIEVNFEMHLFSAIALEYYTAAIIFGFLGVCILIICSVIIYCCCVVCLVYMRCCEPTVRGFLWGRCKFLHRKSEENRRAKALRKRLDRIKENQRLLPLHPDDMDVAHEMKEVQPVINVETSSRFRREEVSDEESSSSSSSSEDEGVKIALIQENTKVEQPKPKPKPKPQPQPAPAVVQQPQNIQIHVALPQQQGPMMVPGQPMLVGHQPMQMGPDGNMMNMGGMIPNQNMGGMMPNQNMMMNMQMQQQMQQMLSAQMNQQPNIQLNTIQSSTTAPVPASPLPTSITQQIPDVEENVEPNAPELDLNEISDDEILFANNQNDDLSSSGGSGSSSSSSDAFGN